MMTTEDRLALAEERIVALEKRVGQLEFLGQFGDVLPREMCTFREPDWISGGEWLAKYREEEERDG